MELCAKRRCGVQVGAAASARVAVAAAVLLLLCCCGGGGTEMGSGVIVQNATFTLTGDTLRQGGMVAAASPKGDRIVTSVGTAALLDTLRSWSGGARYTHGKPWHGGGGAAVGLPTYASDQPLVDALCLMSGERAAAAGASGRYGTGRGVSSSRLCCSIFLSLAWLQPAASMATLRSLVDRDTLIVQREGQWPVVSDHLGWVAAAWEVYLATGNREWLRYSHRAACKTLEADCAVLQDGVTGLMHGGGYSAAGANGAGSTNHLWWMGYNDVFDCQSLGNNVLAARALGIVDEMAEELGVASDAAQQAERFKDAINQRLWNEADGRYCAFLYGGAAYPMQSPTTDNTSQALCVLWGIADDDRAENLIAHTPTGDCGVNVTYPPTAAAVEPYFANPSWATTQALWNMAAAYTGNQNALRRGLGALYRAQILYQSQGISLAGTSVDELGTSAANLAMTYRVLAGITLKPEGIEFNPMVPTGMEGTKHIKGLKYRAAELDITIEGSGNNVESMTDNGKAVESAFLPHDISGKHQVVIKLSHAHHATQRVTLHHNEVELPATADVRWRGDSGVIVGFDPAADYRLVVNGEQRGSIVDSVFALPDMDDFAVLAVVCRGDYGYGYVSRPLPALSLTPQMAVFADSVGGHTSMTVSVAQGGDYLLDVGYSPTGSLDVRQVTVNTHHMGTVVMARDDVSHAQGSGLCYSNMVVVKLLRGDNRIEFEQVRLPKSFTPCQPQHVRIIKK